MPRYLRGTSMSGFRVFLLLAILLLSACGHGFEGKYDVSVDNPFLGMLGQGGSVAQGKLTIGRDFVIIDGDRSAAKISVRKVGDKRYLVLGRDSGDEDLLEIIDKHTLRVQDGMNSVMFTRS